MKQVALYEHTFKSFCALINRIKRLGYDEETAAEYAVIIGDTPALDENGKTVVTDASGKVLAVLDLNWD